MPTAWVYTMANHTRTMYTGVTKDLERRIWEHKHDHVPTGFTAKYKLHKLVFVAEFSRLDDAIAYEKYIKGKNGPGRWVSSRSAIRAGTTSPGTGFRRRSCPRHTASRSILTLSLSKGKDKGLFDGGA